MSLIIVAASTASTAKALSTAAARRIGLWLGLVDLQSAAAKLRSIQSRYRLVSFRCIGHFDKAEAAGSAGFAVRYDADFLDRAMSFKQAA